MILQILGQTIDNTYIKVNGASQDRLALIAQRRTDNMTIRNILYYTIQ